MLILILYIHRGCAVTVLYAFILRPRLKEREKGDGTLEWLLKFLLGTGTCHFHISLVKAGHIEVGTPKNYISQKI